MRKTKTICKNAGNKIKRKTPLYDALRKHASSGAIPFHMPGHKLGAGLPYHFKRDLAEIDLTEIPGTDNLHKPEGIILEAQKLAAKAFGSHYTFFLVNGSSSGIHTIISTICNRGDTLIVSRDCHKSAITGMILAGVKPVYIMPEFDEAFGITTLISVSLIEEALKEHPEAVGVLLTRPNYYGMCCDLKQIAELVHSYGKILAVDEAHGPHLGFSEDLPCSAMDAGADLCVQSAHKTLPALTQSAYLHVGNRGTVDIDRLKFYSGVFQTSSPSYILMSSLDIARDIMQREGKLLLKRLLNQIRIAKIKYRHENICYLSGQEHDASRIVLNVKKLGISGFEAEDILKRKFNIQVEMADLYNVVCIATISDSREHINRLFKSFRKLATIYTCKGNEKKAPEIQLVKNALSIIVSDMENGLDGIAEINSEKVYFQNASGKMCLDIVAAYPPGVPLLCPGEIITDKIIEQLKWINDAGGTILGMDDDKGIRVASS